MDCCDVAAYIVSVDYATIVGVAIQTSLISTVLALKSEEIHWTHGNVSKGF